MRVLGVGSFFREGALVGRIEIVGRRREFIGSRTIGVGSP